MNTRSAGLTLAALLLLAASSARAAEDTPKPSRSQTAKSGPWVVNRVRFVPAPERAQAMVGGRFTGSNDSQTTGYMTLAEITTLPKDGDWTELKFTNTQSGLPRCAHCAACYRRGVESARLLRPILGE